MNEKDRIISLEVLAAEQEKTIEELSEQIALQWKEIEALRKRVDMLVKRLAEIEERTAPDVPVTRPPHW